jgi:hypothetical protein
VALDSVGLAPIRQSAAKLEDATMGTITGKVVTTDNAPLGLVSVVVSPAGVSAITREDGTFTLPPLPPGRYTIEARRIGYERARLDDVQLTRGDTAHANLALAASTLSLSQVVVTGAAAGAPKVGSACFALDVDEGGDGGGMPMLPRRVSFRVAPAPLESERDAAKSSADRIAAPAPAARRAFAGTVAEPSTPLLWRSIAPDSIEVIWPTESDVVTLRLELRETALRGTMVRGTATSSQVAPPRKATVSGRKVVCGGG